VIVAALALGSNNHHARKNIVACKAYACAFQTCVRNTVDWIAHCEIFCDALIAASAAVPAVVWPHAVTHVMLHIVLLF